MNFLFDRKTKSLISPGSGRSWEKPSRPPAMRMKWHDLLFLNWPIDPDLLASHLPKGLEIDLFQSEAWISIVPFKMSGVAPRWFPDLPWLSTFPELNVRTYVVVDGKPGVWFFTLDATNWLAVRVARSWFHLNYVDADIEINQSESWIRYRSKRIERNSSPAQLSVDYRPLGEPFFAEPGSLDHWLTSRYCLYAADPSGRLYRGEIDHSPWQLRETQAVIHSNSMLEPMGIALSDRPARSLFARQIDVVAWSLDRLAPTNLNQASHL